MRNLIKRLINRGKPETPARQPADEVPNYQDGTPVPGWEETKAYYEKAPYLRSIDKQIIERVMGWEIMKETTIGCSPAGIKSFMTKTVFLVDQKRPDWPPGVIFVPSESERNAGEVLNWLVRQGHDITVRTLLDKGKPKSYCHIAFEGNGWSWSVTTELVDTRPLAICLAALEVVERWGA